MCTYSQLKKNMCNPPPPQAVNGTPKVPKLCASCGIYISKCIEGGSICNGSRRHFRVIIVFFKIYFIYFLKTFKIIFWKDLVKAKPL